jgi:hypothetical protein
MTEGMSDVRTDGEKVPDNLEDMASFVESMISFDS